ncbi:MAG: glucose-1-phosphate adenylyltransferase [Clostridia bacterium]|nr:glucose-1-phosphate adenylyltransferase [Clostridia bacterium]MBO4797316.1 glucose-1-phosphate adenylyltransferase [Candidatus Methanomethylophilaceae archaeon]
MYQKKECVAMLLAGGQGSRLYTLTEKTAKPAVPFGGKYRIIDFPLSNCVNSGLDTVGVLTQYQPLQLNEYIGNGQPWDLDRTRGGVMVLPPYQRQQSADWYSGTANAIFQNLQFIDRYDPDYVLILSGDHIYKMDYEAMLSFHKKAGSDCTISVLQVPLAEASRFGIMNADETGRIVEFEEKPKHPKSTNASMGIYIFGTDVLKEYLISDDADPKSTKDFGRDIIPKMLADGKRLFAYPFSGYWKDVGTIESLWEANMDLLGVTPSFDLFDQNWRIYSRSTAQPPHLIGPDASLSNSLVTEGCEIYGTVENSVLSDGVIVEAGAVVRESVIMSGAVIRKNASVRYSIVDSETVIGEGARVGSQESPRAPIAVVGGSLEIPPETVIEAGEMVNASRLDEIRRGGDKR